jgi:hypothetical protein
MSNMIESDAEYWMRRFREKEAELQKRIERLNAHIERVQAESHEFKLKWKSEVGGLKGQNAQLRRLLDSLVSYTKACERMLNASPAGQVIEAEAFLAGTPIEYACHIDLEEGQEPDECVLDGGIWDHCFYARKYGEEARKHCGEWKPVVFK